MTENVKTAGEVTAMSFSEDSEQKELACEKHGRYSGVVTRMVAMGKNWVIETPCPSCEEERKKADKEEKEGCKKDMLAKIEKCRTDKLREMNIGEKFWNESFDTFNAYTDELKRYLQICVAFAENPQGRMLVMDLTPLEAHH